LHCNDSATQATVAEFSREEVEGREESERKRSDCPVFHLVCHQGGVTSPVVDLPYWRPVFQSSLHKWLFLHTINSPSALSKSTVNPSCHIKASVDLAAVVRMSAMINVHIGAYL